MDDAPHGPTHERIRALMAERMQLDPTIMNVRMLDEPPSDILEVLDVYRSWCNALKLAVYQLADEIDESRGQSHSR